MKEQYESAKVEIINFEAEDVITTSTPNSNELPDDEF